MANAWVLTAPAGTVTINWPSSSPVEIHDSVIGMSKVVIGRTRPVWRHISSRRELTLHHLYYSNSAAWDTVFGTVLGVLNTISGGVAALPVDFQAVLTGPSSYSQTVRIIDARMISYIWEMRAWHVEIQIEEASL